jgi:hypothetical protein
MFVDARAIVGRAERGPHSFLQPHAVSPSKAPALFPMLNSYNPYCRRNPRNQHNARNPFNPCNPFNQIPTYPHLFIKVL